MARDSFLVHSPGMKPAGQGQTRGMKPTPAKKEEKLPQSLRGLRLEDRVNAEHNGAPAEGALDNDDRVSVEGGSVISPLSTRLCRPRDVWRAMQLSQLKKLLSVLRRERKLKKISTQNLPLPQQENRVRISGKRRPLDHCDGNDMRDFQKTPVYPESSLRRMRKKGRPAFFDKQPFSRLTDDFSGVGCFMKRATVRDARRLIHVLTLAYWSRG